MFLSLYYFPNQNIFLLHVPIFYIDNNIHILELFHGPTLAFKDFGARFMARTMEKVVSSNDKELNIQWGLDAMLGSLPC